MERKKKFYSSTLTQYNAVKSLKIRKTFRQSCSNWKVDQLGILIHDFLIQEETWAACLAHFRAHLTRIQKGHLFFSV